MPKVETESGVKHFPYTKDGKKAAARAAVKAAMKKHMMKGGKMMDDDEMMEDHPTKGYKNLGKKKK